MLLEFDSNGPKVLGQQYVRVRWIPWLRQSRWLPGEVRGRHWPPRLLRWGDVRTRATNRVGRRHPRLRCAHWQALADWGRVPDACAICVRLREQKCRQQTGVPAAGSASGGRTSSAQSADRRCRGMAPGRIRRGTETTLALPPRRYPTIRLRNPVAGARAGCGLVVV